jgi:hypothetical protein
MRISLVSLESFYDHSLALDYMAAFASRQLSCHLELEFDLLVQHDDIKLGAIIDRILDTRPEVVGFNTYLWNIEESVAAVRAIKAAIPSVVTVFGGMEATFNSCKILNQVPEVDFVVVGEGEIPFSQLLGTLAGNVPFSRPQRGLGWRNDRGTPIVGGPGEVIENLDEIPSPFQNTEFASRGLQKVLYESYRGCAFRCSFCLYQRDYTSLRYMSDDRVMADLTSILDSGVTHIRFVDATFNLNKIRTKRILRHLQGCRADVCVEVSAEFFDEEMVRLLPMAGVSHVDIGLQSTQRAPLHAVQREWYREERFKENLALLQSEPSLTLNVELIAGLPGDSPIGLRKSLNDAVLCWPDHISVYRLLGLKGSLVDRDAEKLGLQFASSPPYELTESKDFSHTDLVRIDELVFAHLILFNLGVGRYAFRYVVEMLGLLPCEIYEQFLDATFAGGQYTREEARFLGRHHAYGNRFDQAMPLGLGLERVKQATDFFVANMQNSEVCALGRRLMKELVDFGCELARLDSWNQSPRAITRSNATEAAYVRRVYSEPTISELVRQGRGIGALSSGEVVAIVFFVHPELGPVAFAADEITAQVLDELEMGIEPSNYQARSELQQLGLIR